MENDLIRRSALMEALQKDREWALEKDEIGFASALWDAMQTVKRAPTIDVVPVVHGRWIANNICSVCKEGIRGYAIQSGYKFCPNCGAKMDAEDTNIPTKDGGTKE